MIWRARGSLTPGGFRGGDPVARCCSRPINGMIDDLPSEARNLPNFTVKLNESSRNDRTSPWRLNRPGRTNKISSTIVEAASELYVRWFKRSGPTNWLRDKCCSASERRRELKWRINHLPKMEFSEIQNFTSFCFQFQRTNINTKQGHGIVKIKKSTQILDKSS